MKKNDEKILLSHGSGGSLTHELIEDFFRSKFSNPLLDPLGDSAVLNIGGKRFAFTTDSFVVDPIFFPGGDIGSLAIHGTVNDLSVSGARALYISCAIVMEEGFALNQLERIVRSMKKAAASAGVKIVTGDTKVVERGAADKIFINTSGIGVMEGKASLSTKKIKAQDSVIVTGTIGDHGAAILSKRKGLNFNTNIKSDSASLKNLAMKLIKAPGIKLMRDPTRGGIATTLNEIVMDLPLGIEIYEEKLPIKSNTRGLCEILGMDPLYFPNEGMALVICSPKGEKRILKLLKNDKLGKKASKIGKFVKNHPKAVTLRTSLGSTRLIEMLSGDQLPRIC